MSADIYRAVLVDDVADLRYLVRLALERSGRFDVVAEGATGLDAVDLAREHRPHVMLLDISMPERDGLEALPEILLASPGTRIVMLSGFEETKLGERSLKLGASAYLEKGARPREIVQTLLEVAES